MTQLAKRAVRKIERFKAETGEQIVFHQTGRLKIARLPEHVEQLQREVERGAANGTGVEMISPAEARAKNPFLHTSGIRAVIYSPTDLYLEPSQIPLGYARAAPALGAEMLPHTPVTGIVMRDGAVERVVTDRDDPLRDGGRCGRGLVRACRALTGAMSASVPTRHQFLITEPIEGVEAMQPIARIIDVNVYIRPDEGGLMLGGYEPDPLQYDTRALPARLRYRRSAARLRRPAPASRIVCCEQFPVFQRVPTTSGCASIAAACRR